MKSRETLIRLKRFQADEKRRRLAQIETMIAEFTRIAAELDREIAAEEKRTGISDPNHFAYPTYARAASQRRGNLHRSAQDLHAQLDAAREALHETLEELRKAESLDSRERAPERAVDGILAQNAAASALRASI